MSTRSLPVLSSHLKLYCFEPESYGSQWYVVAASREEAIEAVKQSEREKTEKTIQAGADDQDWQREWLSHTLSTIDAYAANDPKRGSLTEEPLGFVISTEVC